MTSERQRIVVGIDGSEGSELALEWAVDEARRRHAILDAVTAWQPPYVSGYPVTTGTFDPRRLEEGAREILDHAVDSVDARGLPEPIGRFVNLGSAATTLIEAAKGADLLVVGTRGRGGFTGLLLGSVSQQVAHHAPCPVVIVPPDR
jgi:nucleotide-binding universal stress UspA family protein